MFRVKYGKLIANNSFFSTNTQEKTIQHYINKISTKNNCCYAVDN